MMVRKSVQTLVCVVLAALSLSACLDSGSNDNSERNQNLLDWWVQYGGQFPLTITARSYTGAGTQDGQTVTAYKSASIHWANAYSISSVAAFAPMIAAVGSLIGKPTFKMTEPNVYTQQIYTALNGAPSWGNPLNLGTSSTTTFDASGTPVSTSFHSNVSYSALASRTVYSMVNNVPVQMVFYDSASAVTGSVTLVDINGAITMATFLDSDGSTIIAQVTATVDASNRIDSQLIKVRQSGLLVNSLQWTYTYAGTELYPSTALAEQWDSVNSIWVITQNTTTALTGVGVLRPAISTFVNKLGVTIGSQSFAYNFANQPVQVNTYSDYLSTLTGFVIYSY